MRLVKGGDTFWSAVNHCRAAGKTLASVADLGITGGYTEGCSGSACIGADWEALKNAFRNLPLDSYLWLKDTYDDCNSYMIDIQGEKIHRERNNMPFKGLCR